LKKIIWITFFTAIVLVNLAAWMVETFSGLYIVPLFRVALIFGITMITMIFTGAFMLINKIEEESPLTGHDQHSLQHNPTQVRDADSADAEI